MDQRKSSVMEYNHGAPGASFQRKKSQLDIKALRNGSLQKTPAQLGNKRAEFWKGLPLQVWAVQQRWGPADGSDRVDRRPTGGRHRAEVMG